MCRSLNRGASDKYCIIIIVIIIINYKKRNKENY